MTKNHFATYVGQLRILTVNDVYTDTADSNGVGGWAALSTMLTQYRLNVDDGVKTLLIVNGDFLGGSQLAEWSQGKYVIEILNHLQVDFVVLGNHEYDFGPQPLLQRMKESDKRMRWLGSNVRNNDSARSLFNNVSDYSIESISCIPKAQWMQQRQAGSKRQKLDDKPVENGVNGHPANGHNVTAKIGLFGLCTEATPVLAFPTDAVVFEDTKQHAKRVIDDLHHTEQASGIIAITHLHMTEDKRLAEFSASQCAQSIDLICGGHDHRIDCARVADTMIIKSGQNAEWLGVIDLTVEVDVELEHPVVKPSTPARVTTSFQMLSNKDYEPDPAVLNIVAQYQKLMDEAAAYTDLDEVIATVQADAKHADSEFDEPLSYLTTQSSLVRTQEAVFAQVVADAMVYHYSMNHNALHERVDDSKVNPNTHCDFAIINGGFIRRSVTYDQQVTIRDCLSEMPFPKTIVLMELSGAAIYTAFDQMLRLHPTAAGCFPHVSKQLHVTCDFSAPPMQRVKQVTLNGTPLVADQQYRLAITQFMSLGGDDLTAFKQGKILSTDTHKVVDVVIGYLRNHQHTIDPRLKYRFTRLKS